MYLGIFQKIDRLMSWYAPFGIQHDIVFYPLCILYVTQTKIWA